MQHYMLVSWLTFFTAIFLALYYTREHWLRYFVRYVPERVYNRLMMPMGGSFADDVESGLSSDAFNLSTNLDANDTRAGLDVAAKRQVLKIMKSKGVSFDDARTQFMQQKLAKNNIGPDGRPLDPRAVFFS